MKYMNKYICPGPGSAAERGTGTCSEPRLGTCNEPRLAAA